MEGGREKGQLSKKCPLKTIGRLCNTYTYTTSSGEKDCRVFGAVNSVFVEMMYGLCVCVPVYACLCLCVYCATVCACKRVSVCEGVSVVLTYWLERSSVT